MEPYFNTDFLLGLCLLKSVEKHPPPSQEKNNKKGILDHLFFYLRVPMGLAFNWYLAKRTVVNSVIASQKISS